MTGVTTRLSNPATPQPSPARQSPIRVALVGAGKMGAHHARAIGMLPARARLVAVADPSAEARREILGIAPAAAEYATLPELLTAVAVDVVHVCTPPASHPLIARAALEAGCHIYVEKPFANTVNEADDILAFADARGRLVCAGHQLLFEQPARLAETLLPALGRLVHLESYFSFRTVRRAPGGRAPLRADLQLLDILPHPVYLLLHFLASSSGDRTDIRAIDVGDAGTVHALIRRGSTTGHLVVTLEGRPIESYLRLVGTNGSLHADFVRGTVQRLIGPGTSGLDKVFAPYRLAAQSISGTTSALGRRALSRKRSYPGLAELFDAFYRSIQENAASPISPDSIRQTVEVCAAVASRLSHAAVPVPVPAPRAGSRRIVLTGGTGFLGRPLAAALATKGLAVRVLARREPAAWERVRDVEYVVADLGNDVDPTVLSGADVVIHAAAETAGGWDDHQRNSVDATERLIRSAAEARVPRFVQVSSLAVLARGGASGVDESTPLEPNSRGSGPYVWGKLESERRAVSLGRDLGVEVKVVRPGAIVDYTAFDPPGRLGKRVGPFFVAVGSPGDKLGVVDLAFTTQVLAWIALHFDDAPAVLNLLAPELPRKRDLIRALRKTDPDIRVVWLPWFVLSPLSAAALGLQKLLRPRRPAVNLRRVFATTRYNTDGVRAIQMRMTHE
jgi:predicted dehydrogenase/nucleoside-diphosphate-sugar epimerase